MRHVLNIVILTHTILMVIGGLSQRVGSLDVVVKWQQGLAI